MRKLMGRVLVLALILAAILLLHGYTGRSSGTETVPDAETDSEAEAVPAALEQKEVTLGAMRENAELGGVDITVTAPDGTETTYTFTVTDKARFVQGILRGRTFRERYTVLQYLYDQGKLEEYADAVYGTVMDKYFCGTFRERFPDWRG